MVICTPTKKARIVDMHDDGKTFAEIGRKLEIPCQTASRNYYQMRKTRDPYYRKPKSGRPRKLTERDLRRANRAITDGEACDGADVQCNLFPDVSGRTVRESLCRIGLNGRIRREKPFLTDKHKEKRRAWVEEHQSWEDVDWAWVWFSDESKFNLFGSDGHQYCRRRPGEEFLDRNVKKTVKHGGGSVNVWGCITPGGVGCLHCVVGNMNADQYCKILTESLLGTLGDYDMDIGDIIFQQDNDPKHTANKTKAWFAEHHIEVLSWPPQSPDMSIIEPVWNHLDCLVRARNPLPCNIKELFAALKEEWEKISLEFIEGLYASMPRRTCALAAAGGSYTKY
jgi:hypothetical protein